MTIIRTFSSYSKSIKIEDAARQAGVEHEIAIEFVKNEWVSPADPESLLLDEEDIARLRLIANLRHEFGVNDEAIPIILSLLDQMHQIHFQLRKKISARD